MESGRSSPSPAASPEFEFWMVDKNPGSFPSPALLTADELFSDGVVLPLHTLQPPPSDSDSGAEAVAEDSTALPEAHCDGDGEPSAQQPLAECCAAPPPDLPAVTFKWKDIFKAGAAEAKDRVSKKTERRVSSVSGNSELININIWPFSRSRSAGHSASASVNGATSKAKANATANPNNANANGAAGAVVSGALAMASSSGAPAGRKVSSAPCSRSNSRGETSGPATAAVAVSAAAAAEAAAAAQAAGGPTSMLRRWVPGGHGRAAGAGASGIRLGRASPVWQLRRNKLQQQQAAAEQKQQQAMAKNKAAPAGTQDDDKPAAAAAAAATSVSTPTAAACRNNASCAEGVGVGVGAGEECNPPQGLFGLRTFFSKKVY